MHALHALSWIHGLHPDLMLLLRESNAGPNQITLVGSVGKSPLHHFLTLCSPHSCLLMLGKN
jgi:hypothetical protein